MNNFKILVVHWLKIVAVSNRWQPFYFSFFWCRNFFFLLEDLVEFILQKIKKQENWLQLKSKNVLRENIEFKFLVKFLFYLFVIIKILWDLKMFFKWVKKFGFVFVFLLFFLLTSSPLDCYGICWWRNCSKCFTTKKIYRISNGFYCRSSKILFFEVFFSFFIQNFSSLDFTWFEISSF